MLSRAGLRRLAPLSAVAALACAALPAAAHEGQDDRPGAARMDLEVLLTPPVNGETSTGGQDPALAVDSLGNVLATALKEDPQPATIDQRSPTHVRAASWRWSSGDDGTSYVNVSGRPVQADGLVPGGWGVAAAADDRGRGYLLEAYQGAGHVTVTRSTEKDDVVVEAVHPVAGTGVAGGTRLAAHGDGNVLLLAADPAGHRLVRSDDAGASFQPTSAVTFAGATACDVGAGHGRAVRQVLVACLDGAGAVTAWTSTDDGATFRPVALAGAPTGGARERPALVVGDDGTLSVAVSTTTGASSAVTLHRSTDGGRTWRRQELASERGRWSGVSLATNRRGRLALAAYHRAPDQAWHVRLATFTPGQRPVYVDFASHDPVTPASWSQAPDAGTSVAAGPDGLFHLLWTSVKVTPPASPVDTHTALIRNVWSVRTLSS